MATTDIKFFQGQTFQLAGIGVSIGNTSLTLQSFTQNDGVTLLTMSNFGIMGYGTCQPAEGDQEEQISWTGITQNIDGTATLTGIQSVLTIYPYTGTSGFSQNHGWNTNFVVSNTAGFYNSFANKENDGTIISEWTFNALANNANPKIDSNSYSFTDLDYITKGYQDSVLTEYLRTDGTNEMLAALNMDSHLINNVTTPVSNQDAATKIYVDQSIAAGGVPAVPGTPGLVNIATQAQFNANTNTETISALVYYNMPTIQQVNSVGSAQFTYGESITLNNYVFQADGIETVQSKSTAVSSGSDSTTITSTWYGITFTAESRATTLQSIQMQLVRSSNAGSGNLVAKLYAQSAGVPTGAALATSATILYSSIQTSGLAPDTVFSFSGATITSGTTYAISIETSGVTFSGTTLHYVSAVTGSSTYVTTNSGSTYSTSVSFPIYYVVNQGLTVGDVYKVDIAGILNVGPYKGFALATNTVGTTNAVQIANLAGGFSGLTVGGNVYINPSTPGAIQQGASISNGRAVGTAISVTQIQISPMRKRTVGEAFSSGSVINQEGFLIVNYSIVSSTCTVVESNALTSTPLVSFSAGGEGQEGSITVPVRAGYAYTVQGFPVISSVFYPLING